jgi:hypothetical protein
LFSRHCFGNGFLIEDSAFRSERLLEIPFTNSRSADLPKKMVLSASALRCVPINCRESPLIDISPSELGYFQRKDNY